MRLSKYTKSILVKYKRIFLKYYGLSEYDTIMCWYCEKRVAVDLHHIVSRGMGSSKKLDVIENLIPLCREDHSNYAVIKQKDKLKQIVMEKMKHGK